jgi:hypothetical protein
MAKFSEAEWKLTGKYTIRAASDPEDCEKDNQRRQRIVVVVRANQKYRARDAANARLIRAAPEMYRRLSEMVDCWSTTNDPMFNGHDVRVFLDKIDVE